METNREHTAAPPLGRYAIDTGGSTLAFRTRHLFGLAPVRGTFPVRTGTVDVTEPLTGSRIHAEIETAGFRTGNPARDRAVRSARFLDADRHPVMTFDARRVADGTVTGTLTACGTTRPVTLAVARPEVTPEAFTVRATARVDRTEFGVTASRGMAGRHLDVTLEVRCVRV